MATQVCAECLREKPLDQFSRYPNARRTRSYPFKRCSECVALRQRLRTYGLSRERYDALLHEQDHRCAICRSDDPLHVDHDHDTDEIRGLLCRACNHMLGNAKDRPALLRAAIGYLERTTVSV